MRTLLLPKLRNSLVSFSLPFDPEEIMVNIRPFGAPSLLLKQHFLNGFQARDAASDSTAPLAGNNQEYGSEPTSFQGLPPLVA